QLLVLVISADSSRVASARAGATTSDCGNRDQAGKHAVGVDGC
ncbi:unnamed protein product, partial [Musa hybrid cultivar]